MAFTIGLRIAVCALALMAQTLAQEVPTTEDMQMHSNFTADGEVADAIIFEAAANNPDNIKLLLRTHDPNAENKFGETALHLAAMHFTVGDIRTAEILLEAGADPDKMTHGKIDGHKLQRTPLMWFISYCDPEVVELFLDYGADIHLEDENGMNAVEHADMYGERCQKVLDMLEVHELEYYHHEDL